MCLSNDEIVFFFFFQAEDGIRDLYVTGVQTCALPISPRLLRPQCPHARGMLGGGGSGRGDGRPDKEGGEQPGKDPGLDAVGRSAKRVSVQPESAGEPCQPCLSGCRGGHRSLRLTASTEVAGGPTIRRTLMFGRGG